MGVETKKAPPLPAPTETDSPTPTELTNDDLAKLPDEASHYSLPDDGSPVTIRTRGHRANRSQTSLLIEYFEGGKSGASGTERKPSVRVRLTPSKKHRDDHHIQITETKGSRKTSLTRRIPLSSTATTRLEPEGPETGDTESMRSYASATEESNVSRNPIDIEIDRGSRRRRPASPLIPDPEAKPVAYQPPNMSDISAIPSDSFLDGSGPTNLTSRDVDTKRNRSPSRSGHFAAGVVGAVAGAALAEKVKNAKIRSEGKERAVLPKSSDRSREKERKHRSSRSRTSSLSEKPADGTRSPRRRSSRSHADSAVSAADSSILSSSISPSHRSADQYSVRSGAPKSSINNPKLLETVEDAIRRLILPELSALKREQSKRESRRDSFTSTATGTSASREDLTATDRRRSSGRGDRDSSRYRERRDREARHDYADSQYGIDADSVDDLSVHEVAEDSHRASNSAVKAAAAGAAAAGLAAAVLDPISPSPDDRRQRRRRPADASTRSRSLGRDRYAEEYEDEEPPAPPMPLMSEINPSELTRTSILSVESDRPHSAMEERTSPVRGVSRDTMGASDHPTSSAPDAITFRQTLGTKHANISHGDLRELPQKRTGEYEDGRLQNTPQDYDDEEYETGDRGLGVDPGEYDPDAGFAADYYNTQHVPPPLNYVPYHPDQRGLSPIYSVSGYTEGGSEAAGQRDSRTTNDSASPDKSPQPGSLYSPGSAPGKVVGATFDDRSLDDRSIRSSELEPGQPLRGVGANPNIVDVPVGVESNVASLVDGSMLDQSILTGGGSGLSGTDYGNRDSFLSHNRDSDLSYGEQYTAPTAQRGLSPDKRSVRSQQDDLAERDGAGTPSSSHHNRSREFAGEYHLDEYGRKVAPLARYHNSPSTSRHSPTESEKAIALGAVGAAAAALKAAKDRSKQPTVEEVNEEFVPEGVFRNKSFKQRTLEGREPAHTPAHSVDRLDYEDQPKMGASAMPAWDDPMPELGYVDDALSTNPSLQREEMDRTPTPRGDDNWVTETTPRQDEQSRGLGLAAATGVAAAAGAVAGAAAHSRQPSQEPDDEWQRTSAERKRDTLVTNPYDGASPLANPDLLAGRGLDPDGFGAGYHVASPTGQKNFDEGYISQGPVQSPSIQPESKALMGLPDAGVEDPFYGPKDHTRHLSGMSQGMVSPIYDAATGAGIERIESKDIIALMQHLMVRDAQRTARDTEILVTLVRSAAEMRNSFEGVKKLLAETEDTIINEVKENTEETVKNVIGGPRPYPGSAPRSVKGMSGTSQSQDGTASEDNPKKSLFRRALFRSFGAKDTNDLSRIEDMLNQLLAEVDTLKAQTARPAVSSGPGQSFENLPPEMRYEQDRGYEPEGHAGTSTASHASQSGHLSIPISHPRVPSTKLGGYERKVSDHRISTVHEDNEEDYAPGGPYAQARQDTLSPGGRQEDIQRGSSVPLGTPPRPSTSHNVSVSNENTPKTDRSKKHKSKGSSSWFPKISRWSESTATSVGRALRGSGMSSKRGNDDEYGDRPTSRSASDVAQYDDGQYHSDPYGDDHLHTGFSQTNLVGAGTNEAAEEVPPPPATYMTPEDPKYKAHRNSLNLQHPQPRQGQTERFKAALESQAHEYDSPLSPRSADWAGSATSLNRFPAQTSNRYSGGSAGGAAGAGEYWSSPAATTSAPPRPPKEPLDNNGAQTPGRSSRVSRLQKGSPLAYQSMEPDYGTERNNYTSSPKLENRNLSGALQVPTRRPSGPRAMTPKSPEEEAAREERRRKRGE
ncbi:hypothetical protein SODALDRAFT_337488 [Sodiomyces alkalinus F11]|uniref:Uncharacterized protein n=1 Tax=Sodiomyces alkalinus (strain CBS 110278 / VKM F-3762 / F11) TaxID=1314773 RepID=A0A3N2PLW6_SODAK|nr:hypothetical protein SODALDRAFT_337488 [Sodiomyces alkalinus F11]ROT35512.1 hypothetical protein SODALDRAFT_337488 [Sodiomyces alkalinus F11]